MKNIVRIISISKPLHHLVAILGVLILIGAALELVAPVLSKYIVDEIIGRIQYQTDNLNRLFVLIALSFGASLINIFVTAISERLGDHYEARLNKFLVERFYEKVFTLPQAYFDSEISGKILNQLSRGINSINMFMNTATNFFLPTILQTVFTIIILAYYSLPTAILVALMFPVYTYISYLSTKRWGRFEEQKNKLQDIRQGKIQEVISNIKVVKSFTNEKKEWSFISEIINDLNAIYAKQSNGYHVFNFFRNLSLIIILLVINAIVFYNTYQGLITVGTMVLILQLLAQAYRPLMAMSFLLERTQMAEVGSKEYFEIMSLPSSEEFKTDGNGKAFPNPSITFRNLSFKYDTSDEILKNISFSIKPKEKVALVGHSGAGKTTIINLILKFYEPTTGKIYLNDTPYSSLTHKDVRKNMALVFQENELFSSTIAENVSYGTQASEKEILDALKKANAYEFVRKLPEGIHSEVGERGVRLSGGQKQRIQIARALLSNRPVLILDEATSNLDSQSESLIQEALKNLMKERLVIIIAHRFSTIQNVDRIIVIDNGKITDSGTPKELAKRPGIYSTLLRYQLEGDKKLLEDFEIY